MKRSIGALTLAFVLMLILAANAVAGGVSGGALGGQVYLFSLDTAEEIARLDNDNTGAKLALTVNSGDSEGRTGSAGHNP